MFPSNICIFPTLVTETVWHVESSTWS